MTDRARLPNRRRCESFELECGGQQFTVQLGFYNDGALGEVFVTGAKIGSAVDIAVRDAAVLLSLGLEHGCPPAVFRNAMKRDSEGRPEGPIGTLLDTLDLADGREGAA